MPAKPETRFIASVNRHLPLKRLRSNAKVCGQYPASRHIHYEKMHNDFRGGTADAWYSGRGGDVWIEYKFLPHTPRCGIYQPSKLLSALQADWLKGRLDEGRNVAVIVGCLGGGVLLTEGTWQHSYSWEAWCSMICSASSLAEWILSQTGKSTC
jgi:hypothetical protein